MHRLFRRALEKAEGRSEKLVAVVADIRGFSSFSASRESPDVASYVKRIYIRMMDDFFKEADFCKALGDGLLAIYRYSEGTLQEQVRKSLKACFGCLESFGSICDDDPMINFEVPQNVAFGVARGTACCLFSGSRVLDYSGHLINLVSRLVDFARPSGIVVDGNFELEQFVESFEDSWGKENVYIQGIAEDTPCPIYYLKKLVHIPSYALAPLKGENWITASEFTCTLKELRERGPRFRVPLERPPKEDSKITVVLRYPLRRRGKVVGGMTTIRQTKHFVYRLSAGEPIVRLDLDQIVNQLREQGVPLKDQVEVVVKYVPASRRTA